MNYKTRAFFVEIVRWFSNGLADFDIIFAINSETFPLYQINVRQVFHLRSPQILDE